MRRKMCLTSFSSHSRTYFYSNLIIACIAFQPVSDWQASPNVMSQLPTTNYIMTYFNTDSYSRLLLQKINNARMRCKDPSCHDHATFTSNKMLLELSVADARLQLGIKLLEKLAHSWMPGRVCRCWNHWDIDICYMWSLSRNYEDYNN